LIVCCASDQSKDPKHPGRAGGMGGVFAGVSRLPTPLIRSWKAE
jgi:hypothetical protein